MTDQEDAFGREVEALEEFTGVGWVPRFGKRAMEITYTELAARFREIARRAMACASLADEAERSVREVSPEVITAYPALEPD